ncbi:stage V sporulation protein AD [Paenibacillus cellulositrophicus]|uniref:stage V sporulation protein AD n=1 Tax=Paenibacillus cellulositrophicus TaxID=562959 RepID=UPI00203CFE3B|nr:stage V sporulation protein AD [Paenibacillus cellulositrophicus]MCM2999759.1 stage V sporulation protein AD [Paenibacillus cellulositrophicus]
MKLTGQTWEFDTRPVLIGSAAVVGPDEGQGPLSPDFDYVYDNLEINEKTWEKAERRLLEQAAQLAVIKSGLDKEQIQFYVGGDLMNQIISSTFSARKLGVPYLGVFGACSTSMESLAISALMVDTGAAERVMAGTGSHNCTAEKQFRYPTEYGSQKPPTAQYTVTGAGCGVIAKGGQGQAGPRIARATIGRIMDLGVKDPFNMGAAMAPAAADTIAAHFRDTGLSPDYYDLIVTGDLASVGLPIAKELLEKEGYQMDETKFGDCGLMIYNREKQKAVLAGGSGCGCSAAVTYGYLVKRMLQRELHKVLVVATGSLHSPLSVQQGESIPCIAHAVALEMED